MMRILYVTPAYKPAFHMGGPVASVSAAAERLVQKGHEVMVVTTNANLDQDVDVPLDRPVDVDGVVVRYFRREEPIRKWLPFVPYLSRSMGYAYAPNMKAALEALVPASDVVHTHMPFVYPTYAAARAAERHGKPLLYHQRGLYLPSHLSRRRRKKQLYIALFEKRVMRHATTLVALTEAERDAFRELAPNTPCEIIPNGVDVPAPDPGAAARVEALHGIPRDAVMILFLGRLHEWKGVDELLDAFAAIQRKSSSAYLVLAGVDECNAERRWRPVAQRDGFAARVVFAGPVSGREKSDLLHRADLFTLPSRGEGLSMATLEALAHSTAVMLSPQCNFPEAEAAGAGVTVARNVRAMASAMEELVGDRARLRAMGEAGRRLAVRDYSWDVITDRFIDLYQRSIVRRSLAASSASRPTSRRTA
jgi:glycosyltransferase involved in cell wall biosynthesis